MNSNHPHTVHISRDYGVARVIVTGVDPAERDNVIVQEKVGDEWIDRRAYNSLSNDYAYTSAADDADRIAKRRGRS